MFQRHARIAKCRGDEIEGGTIWSGLMLGLAIAIAPGVAFAQHADIAIYSTSDGGGSLAGTPAPVHNLVFRNAALCFPAACLYSSTDPGFVTPSQDAAALFALDQGTEVSLEIVAIDAAVSVKVGAKVLDAAGDSAVLGTAPSLHVHPTFQVVMPDGATGSFPFSWKLTARSASYADSGVYEMVLSNQSLESTPAPSARPSPTLPTPSVSLTATPTPTPTRTPAPTPAVSSTPRASTSLAPSPRVSPTPGATATPPAEPTPAPSDAPTTTPMDPSPAPTPTWTPTPIETATPPQPVTPGVTVTVSRSPSPEPSPSPSPHPTVAPLAELSRFHPAARGDQVVLLYDASPDAASFVSIANTGAAALDVELLFQGEAMEAPLRIVEPIAARGMRIFDVGALRASGLGAQAGVAFATAVDAAGHPLVTRSLSGSFTIADLPTASAWGGAGAARSARGVRGRRTSVPARGTVIDGTSVVLERFAAPLFDLGSYYDPEHFEPLGPGRSELILISFDDVPDALFDVSPAPVAWSFRATRSHGEKLQATARTTSGVHVSRLTDVLGEGVAGSAGRVEIVASASATTNRLVYFVQSLGSFAAGHALPALSDGPEERNGER